MLKKWKIWVLALFLLSACSTPQHDTDSAVGPQPEIVTLAPVRNPTESFEKPAADAASESDANLISENLTSINPLTGLVVDDLRRLDRRPLLFKVENLPRDNRPQWGLSAADLVFEYYTEEGTTRFAALFYGMDAERVAPIRSARFFDIQLIQMYKAVFVFGSAYEDLLKQLFESDFAERLIIEVPGSCPALCRYDPNGRNILMGNTVEMQSYLAQNGVENQAQPLTGMTFSEDAPQDGQDAQQVFVRFSGAIYNRWDYEEKSGKYLRFVDAENDLSQKKEVYVPLMDRGNDQQISAENVIVLLVDYMPIIKTDVSEVYDIPITGTGWAYLFRDGQAYEVDWKREKPDDILTFTWPNGDPVALKPGQTWFEVLNRSSRWEDQDGVWRFTFRLP